MHRSVRLLLLAAAAVTSAAFGQSGNLGVTTDNLGVVTRVDGPLTGTVALVVTGNGIPFQVHTHTTTGGNWLSVEQSSGAAPAVINVTGNRQGLAIGAYYGSIELMPPTGAS